MWVSLCFLQYKTKTRIMNSNLFKPDPAYQQHVPNLDGGDEASEHILFGTNIDCENGVERGEGYCHAFNSYV